jgi:PII-like signaling protein
MENNPNAKLLRIFIGESDRIGQQPLYERIVIDARKHGLSGATVLRGIMGYGANSRIHSTKLFEISTELPLIVEIVDTEEKIREFTGVVENLFELGKSGGLITIEKAEVILNKPGRPSE